MKKYLVLIASAAIAYNLIGAAASKLTVTQSMIPAQGVDTASTLGACTGEVTVEYSYEDAVSSVAVDLTSGLARYVTNILVIPVGSHTCDNSGGTDIAAITFEEDTSVPDAVDPWEAPSLLSPNVDFQTAIDLTTATFSPAIDKSNGAWVFEVSAGTEMQAFNPGNIWVTLWTQP